MRKTQQHTQAYYIRQLPRAVAFVDTTLHVTLASDRMVECFGHGKRDVKGESVHALFDNISDKWLKQMHAALRGKAKNRGRELLQTKNGAQWLEWVLVPWYDNHENIIGLILEVEDITTTVVQDNAIMEEAETLRTLIDHLPLNVYIKDKNSKRILANQSEVAFCGYHFEDEVIGKDDYDIFEKDDAQESRMEDIEVMTSMRPIIDRETTIHRKGKPAMTVLSSKIPLRAENGNVIGLVGFSHDISNRKKKEEELHKLINLSAEQNKKLIDFAHIVSHNIRSQSANFSMLLSFLNEEGDEKEQDKIIGMLTDASDHLLDTIDNLNDVVTINKSRDYELVDVNLGESLARVRMEMEQLIEKNNALIHQEIPDGLTVKGFPSYIENLFRNLISNAIKFKHPERNPFIQICATQTPGSIFLRIEDNGIGIDLEKDGEKLFGMYKTFHETPESRGLGLFRTKNEIEAIGGRIKCNSEPGIGTVFKVYFHDIR